MAGGNYVYTITLDAGQVISSLSGMESKVQAATTRVGGLQSAFNRIGRAAFAFVNISDSIDRMMSGLDSFAGPGMELNAQMKELSAITGVTGKGLKQIEGYARDAARTFGGSAAESVEAYKLVLSQLGPEIAQVPEALSAMGDSIKTAAKLMGNDTVSAAEVLNTAMNQYQVSLEDPIKASEEMARMMNVMAAAGQAGSAELPAIKDALSQAGMVAKTAGISFEETNAAIQMLDKAGKKGAEGGVALRNVMTTLMQGRFLPADVQEELSAAGVSIDRLADQSLSLAERLRTLTPVMGDQALVSKMFGRENTAAALALLSTLDPMEELTAAITGSNSAYEQAGAIMDSDVEKLSRFQARIDNLKISLYETFSSMLPYVKGFGSALQTTAAMTSGLTSIQSLMETRLAASIRKRVSATWQAVTATTAGTGSLGLFSVAAGVARMACHGLAAGFRAIGKAIYAIPIIGWIAAGISLVVKGFQLLWDNCEGFRQILFGTWEWLKTMFYNVGVFFTSIWESGIKPVADFIGTAFRTVTDGVVSAFNWVKDNIVGVFSWVWEKVSGIFNQIKSLATSVVSWIADKFSWLIDPIVRVFDKIGNFVKATFDKIKNGIVGTVEGIKSFFQGKGFKSGRDAYMSGMQKGSESWANDHPEGQSTKRTETALPVSGTGMFQPNGMAQSKNPIGSGMPQGGMMTTIPVDLNNVKGSTNYAAVAARLQPKTFSGLGGGRAGTLDIKGIPEAVSPSQLSSFLDQPEVQKKGFLQKIAHDVAKMAAGVTIIAMPPVPVHATGGPIPPVLSVKASSGISDENRIIHFEKFCEKVEINVPQGTTDSQVDYLLAELMRRINDGVK